VATYCAQPPRARSRSSTASGRPAAAAACSGYLKQMKSKRHAANASASLEFLELSARAHRLSSRSLRGHGLLPNDGEQRAALRAAAAAHLLRQ
jgi:hypothetical protein